MHESLVISNQTFSKLRNTAYVHSDMFILYLHVAIDAECIVKYTK